MDWRGRLRELKRAGGTVAMAAAVAGCVPVCNGNPDPCCRDPKSQLCAEWQGCEDLGKGERDFEACYYHWDLSVPDLNPPADLVTVHDVGSDHD